MGHDPARFDIFPAGLPKEIKARVVKMSKDMGIPQQKIYEEALRDFEKYRAGHTYEYKEYEGGRQTSIRLRIETKKRMLSRARTDDISAKTVMCNAIKEFYEKLYG